MPRRCSGCRRRAETLLDEVGYWRVLAAAGRATEAQQLTQDYSRPPANPFEVVALAQAHAALGQVARARELLDRFAQQFVTASEIWMAHADLLLDRQQWEEARADALKMRQQNGVRDALMAFSYYVESRAEFAQRRPDLAEASFAKAAQFAFEPPRLSNAARIATSSVFRFRPGDPREDRAALETDADYCRQRFPGVRVEGRGAHARQRGRLSERARPGGPSSVMRRRSSPAANVRKRFGSRATHRGPGVPRARAHAWPGAVEQPRERGGVGVGGGSSEQLTGAEAARITWRGLKRT